MSRRPDPKQLTNRQRLPRVEHLKKRRCEDKQEMATLTELIMADLNASRT